MGVVVNNSMDRHRWGSPSCQSLALHGLTQIRAHHLHGGVRLVGDRLTWRKPRELSWRGWVRSWDHAGLVTGAVFFCWLFPN